MGASASLDTNGIVLYSLSHCPFCNKAKLALKKHGITVDKVYELDEMPNRTEMQDMLKTASGGVRTVPQLYVNGKFIGGSDAIVAWAETNGLV